MVRPGHLLTNREEAMAVRALLQCLEAASGLAHHPTYSMQKFHEPAESQLDSAVDAGLGRVHHVIIRLVSCPYLKL